jgi:tetraacyldisaccharide 4'-kinase
LLPFSLLYSIIIILRNMCYDLGILKSEKFDLPVICVGNLVLGGSGKTPVTEYLVDLLKGYQIAILSRGYGRETKGFIYADEHATAKSIGDEPLQFYHKFPGVTVAVSEDRVFGIKKLKDDHDLIILDDAFQHRAVQPGLSILLFEYQKLLRPQFVLPAGNMREPFWGYRRAELLLVTKAPLALTETEKSVCAGKFAANAKLFFSAIKYGELIGLYTGERVDKASVKGKTVFLLTGIANPQPLLDELNQYTQIIIHHDYPDHHSYSQQNLNKLLDAFTAHPGKEKIIVTTEKDAQRLFDVTFKELLLNLPVFYLPIKVIIEEDQTQAFNQKILKYVSDTARNR